MTEVDIRSILWTGLQSLLKNRVMLSHKRVIQNKTVAKDMRQFFRYLRKNSDYEIPSNPAEVAKDYGRYLMHGRFTNLAYDKRISRSRFYVGLSAGGESLDILTKRAALITDTLLLSHARQGQYHRLSQMTRSSESDAWPSTLTAHGVSIAPLGGLRSTPEAVTEGVDVYGIHCPSLEALGKWILDAESLLKAGLAWYLPSYSTSTHLITGRMSTDPRQFNGLAPDPVSAPVPHRELGSLDFLIRDRRAVDLADVEPIKSQLVRPILQIDLPFIEGVNLRDFSQITIEEFASYSAFRDFLRMSFLQMDDALNSVQSDRELVKLSLQIKDQVRAARSQMQTVKRKRAVAASGAMVATVEAVLAAVYGPAMQEVLTAVGGGGGVWGIVNAVAAEHSTRSLKQDAWYYVWVLSRKSDNGEMG